MRLAEVAIRAARAVQRPYKVSDEKGLYLLVKPNGARLWRYKYRHAGIEKLLAIGRYPDVSLREARDRRDDARKLVANHVDPSLKKRIEREGRANTFAAVGEEWLETKRVSLSASTWQRDRDQSAYCRAQRLHLKYFMPCEGKRLVMPRGRACLAGCSVLPKDSLGEAVHYALKHWSALTRFTKNRASGCLEQLHRALHESGGSWEKGISRRRL